ncbi:hypothetical protein [Mycobacterium simiae]|uniref:hypothetical protein n=1 Tax=Mycobacterium simiae TaxID=1784 RepID=UPI0026262C61|nr:hypothetical protein [Mycobacterium simiae]
MNDNVSPEGTSSGDSNYARRVANAALAGRLVSAVGADDAEGANAAIVEIFSADTEGVLLALAAMAGSERGQEFLDEYAMAALDASRERGSHDDAE